MDTMQFDIWLANLPTMEGSRVIRGLHPVIVVSNDTVNQCSPVITVVPLTSKLKRLSMPTHVVIRDQGLLCDSVALCEQIMSLDKNCLKRRVGYVHRTFDRYALAQGISVQLGLVS